MSNNIEDDFVLVAKTILAGVSDQQVVHGHLNQEYNKDLLQAVGPAGSRNRSVTIIVEGEIGDAEIFEDEIKITDINETEVVFTVKHLFNISFGFTYIQSQFRQDVVQRSLANGVKAVIVGTEKYIAREFYSTAKPIFFANDKVETTADLARLSRFLSDDLHMDNTGGNVAIFVNSETVENLQGNKVLYNNSAKGKEYFDRGFITKSGVARGTMAPGNGYLFTYDSADFYKWNLLQKLETAGIKDVVVDEFAGDVEYFATKVDGKLIVKLVNKSAAEFVIPKGVIIKAGLNGHLVLEDIVGDETENEIDITSKINNHELNVESANVEIELRQVKDLKNVAINKDAVLLAMFAPDTVIGAIQGKATDPRAGVGLRVTYGYKDETKSSTISVDCMIAVKNVQDGVAIF